MSRVPTPSHAGGIAFIEFNRGITTHWGPGFWGAWSPDGERIAFSGGTGEGAPKVFAAPINRRNEIEQLTHSPNTETVVDWATNGQFILYASQSNDSATATQSGIWVLPLADRKPFLFVRTAYRQAHGQFSPDGHWIAYTSTESGRAEVYVQSFPEMRSRSTISINGGDYPRWSRNGHELFYVAADQTLMAVPVTTKSDRLEFASPLRLFKLTLPRSGTQSLLIYPYDIAPNGEQVLGFTPAPTREAQTLVVLSGWQTESRN
jgi:Tol biopolymer transport system component